MTERVLCVLTCASCGFLVHPPVPRCPECASRDLDLRPVSGRGTVWSCTATPAPDGAEPVVIAVVELAEQEGVRLLTNLVGIALDDVAIGMPVRARLVVRDGVEVPVFEPDRASGEGS